MNNTDLMLQCFSPLFSLIVKTFFGIFVRKCSNNCTKHLFSVTHRLQSLCTLRCGLNLLRFAPIFCNRRLPRQTNKQKKQNIRRKLFQPMFFLVFLFFSLFFLFSYFVKFFRPQKTKKGNCGKSIV